MRDAYGHVYQCRKEGDKLVAYRAPKDSEIAMLKQKLAIAREALILSNEHFQHLFKGGCMIHPIEEFEYGISITNRALAELDKDE